MRILMPPCPSSSSSSAMKNAFLYFAYGSNMLTERIRINSPTAVKKAVAKLEGYDLVFNLYGERWRGAVATIAAEDNNHVWGVLWEVENANREALDRQEMGYNAIQVNVTTADGKKLKCVTYLMKEPLQGDRRPSTVYKSVIVNGALENELPKEYIEKLKKIEDNGYNGPVEVNLSFRG